jgi:hypothetical protein
MLCPVCGTSFPDSRRASPRLEVLTCGACSHRVGIHHAQAEARAGQDMHGQYGRFNQAPFLDSLEATRRRQAKLLVALIRRNCPRIDSLLDYGSGRGWFVSACREAGFRKLAGADLSKLALQWLKDEQADAIDLSASGEAWKSGVRRLGFRPEAVSLLDVIEHFRPEELEPTLRKIAAELAPELRCWLIKVPVSSGFFYWTASILAVLGRPGPLERLFQVGSLTPHHHYFSAKSMKVLAQKLGLRVVEDLGDRDFEGRSFPERLGLTGSFSAAVTRALGVLLEKCIQVTGLHDSRVFLATTADPRQGQAS